MSVLINRAGLVFEFVQTFLRWSKNWNKTQLLCRNHTLNCKLTSCIKDTFFFFHTLAYMIITSIRDDGWFQRIWQALLGTFLKINHFVKFWSKSFKIRFFLAISIELEMIYLSSMCVESVMLTLTQMPLYLVAIFEILWFRDNSLE